MRKNFLLLLIVVTHLPVSAQSLSAQDSTLFDFWVGEWELTWTNSKGNTEKGRNRIGKILDGKVIQENFRDEAGKFKGISISVYNSKNRSWHQAWADNQGGYFDFEGGIEADKRIFKTKMKEIGSEKVIQRMVFYHVLPTSFTWDWEISRDNGATWQLQWRIYYVRKNS